MDHNDSLYPIDDGKSKKKKIGDIVYSVTYALLFSLVGATFFLIYKVIQAHMANML